jgi:hypothetical protein
MLTQTAFLLAAALALPAFAADEQADEAPKKEDLATILKGYSTDLSIPDTPGLAIVGLTSENVIRPNTPRKLGVAILQGRNESGAAKQGFALDFAPLKVFNPGMTKKEYADSPYVGRPLWNSQISLGVGQPLSDADKSTRIGIGLSSVLWRKESSDPLLNEKHGACLTAALREDLPGEFPGLDEGAAKPAAAAAAASAASAATGGKQAKKAVKPTLKSCFADLEKETWNASALMIGVATSKASGRDPAVVPDATPMGYWVSFNYGFESVPSLQKTLQFTGTYRRLQEELVTDPADKTKFVVQNSYLFGAKLYGRNDVANLFIEASRKRSTILGRETERSNLFVFGAERKLSDNLWLTIAMGTKRGGTSTNPTYVSTSLKFGYEDAASIKP